MALISSFKGFGAHPFRNEYDLAAFVNRSFENGTLIANAVRSGSFPHVIAQASVNEGSATQSLLVTSVLDGTAVSLRSPELPALGLGLTDTDWADMVRVSFVLSDGTAYFGKVPRKFVSSLRGTTVDFGDEPLSIEIVTIGEEAS